MDIRVLTGAIQESDAEAVVISLFEGVTAPEGAARLVDEALNGAVSDLLGAGDFTGASGQVVVLYPRGALPARRVMLVGLGKQSELNVEAVRHAAAHAALKARDLKVKRLATILHGAGQEGLSAAAAAYAVVEGTRLALYRYQAPRQGESLPEVEALELLAGEGEAAAVQQAVEQAEAVVAGVTLARDLVNLPPNICTPSYLAEAATAAADAVGLRVQVLERGQMQALGMNALLAVAQGSETPPRFIILEHNATRAGELPSIVLVGKGITFDTGGYNLKPTESMATMKTDMAGGAAVIGALRAIGALKVPLHVVGLVPAADNMISGHAYRPQEVIRASNGVTIEISNTDAEGRMLLADALVFAARFKPSAVVDIATLTGACVVALGAVAAGLFSTSDALRDVLLAAAEATNEKLWPLPLYPEYEKAIESKVADIQNTGGRTSGVGASATFLKHFVSYPAWAHIDMAGLAANAKDNPYIPEGATGYGVRLLTEFVRRWTA
ncbi:MAG: leucyl aminopeptidase [Anaerolineae bacterium]|nr:leucyl aminopeptidase [Anaerolineae bacterium]